MAPRKYDQRLRATSADETRRRILDALRQRLHEAPTEPLSLDTVAHLAGVARSTIYQVFGSRAGLLDAFAEDLWTRAGMANLTEAVSVPDAREHLRGGFDAATRMYAAEPEIYRVLFAMSRIDPDSVGGAVRTMDTGRAGGMIHLARRLDEDGLLRPGLTVETAADILWMLCSFEAFDHLHATRGRSLDDTIALLIDTAERTLLA